MQTETVTKAHVNVTTTAEGTPLALLAQARGHATDLIGIAMQLVEREGDEDKIDDARGVALDLVLALRALESELSAAG